MPKRTALYEEHQKLGGRLIDFGGWELPVQYTGTVDEHQTCRSTAGLFDVSHMGEVLVEGPDAEGFLNYLLTNDVRRLNHGQAQYTLMCNHEGGILDDLLVYRRDKNRFFLVVNAGNTETDYEWMRDKYAEAAQRFPKVKLSNESANYTQIAIQGPKSEAILQKFTHTDLKSMRYYWFTDGKVYADIPALIARTGYTGEDGFEVYVPWDRGPELWRALMEEGAEVGLKPCGLGARDTLRLEMRFPLYGHELTTETNPFEAGLGWVVKMDKEDFVGKAALAEAKKKGNKRKLAGFKLKERGIPRQGYPIVSKDGERIGEVTSGTQSPSLEMPIGIGYVATDYTAFGTEIYIDIRGRKVPAEVVATPFYKRANS